MCSKIDAMQQDEKFLLKQRFELGIGSAPGTKCGGSARILDQAAEPNLALERPSRGRNAGRFV
jgi:hypothetical protein